MTGGFASRWLAGPEIKQTRLLPRSAPLEDTKQRVERFLPHIPVTRLADISPLDTLSASVFCAVTPLARDLTTHMGKGPTAEAARVSAMMEAVERISAETFSGRQQDATWSDLQRRGLRAVDPDRYVLPSDTGWSRDASVRWVEGWCLIQDHAIWMPADLAVSPPSEGLIHLVDTNGLASGNTRLEAVLHALCEVIERDAIGQHTFVQAYGDPGEGPACPAIDPKSLPPAANQLLLQLGAGSRQITLQDMTEDIPVPVVRAVLTDAAYPGVDGPGTRAFIGYGCDPCAEVATIRAMTEAAQALLAVVQGARDSFNESPPPHTALPGGEMVSFDALPNHETEDLAEDLVHILDCLRAVGVPGVHAVDLTRPDWGLPVVRVRVPGLTSYLVDPSRQGWRCHRWLL
ncbi:MAG: YcaO-like family protein [Pseudomonadota bacterium]